MPILKQGDSGKVIELLNGFLESLGLSHDSGSVFGNATHEGVKQLQSQMAFKSPYIKVDGIAGSRTLGHACALSPSDTFSPQTIAAALGIEYPPRLAGLPSSPTTDRMNELFGRIEYKKTPLADNIEHITITNDWESKYLTKAPLKGAVGISDFSGSDGNVRMAKSVVAQMQGLWAFWRDRNLLGPNIHWSGLWNARLKRGGTTLSNHAWGTAFDINASANPLGCLPAFPGENGSLFGLVESAQRLGFGWGGHFTSRLDGMHFEVVKILSASEVEEVLRADL